MSFLVEVKNPESRAIHRPRRRRTASIRKQGLATLIEHPLPLFRHTGKTAAIRRRLEEPKGDVGALAHVRGACKESTPASCPVLLAASRTPTTAFSRNN
jgi:hypothetical protein